MSGDLMTLTREDMARAATSSWGLGYVQAQIDILKEVGADPSKNGWLKDMVGKVYRREWFDRLMAAGDARRRVKYAEDGVPLEAGPVNFFKEQEKRRQWERNRGARRFPKRRNKRHRHQPQQQAQNTPDAITVHERTVFVAKDKRDELFADPVYKVVRAAVLRRAPWCKLCGRRPPEVALHVDHIIPLTVDWSRRMDPNNLQVLCADCNIGKSNYWS
jgi:5-methylcytosine-specific restriction endonuclease McrA